MGSQTRHLPLPTYVRHTSPTRPIPLPPYPRTTVHTVLNVTISVGIYISFLIPSLYIYQTIALPGARHTARARQATPTRLRGSAVQTEESRHDSRGHGATIDSPARLSPTPRPLKH